MVGTAWWGVEAAVLETHEEGGSRVPGFGAPGMPGGVRTVPCPSVVRISHLGEELPAVGPWEAVGSALPAPRGAAEGDGARSPSGGCSRDCAAAVPRTANSWRCKGASHSPRYTWAPESPPTRPPAVL